MADRKISELPELNSSDVVDGDWVVVTDSSTNTSKKLDFGDYKITQSRTDTTPGRLTKVGDFGFGSKSPPFMSDLDAVALPSGLYHTVDTTLNISPLFPHGFGTLLQLHFPEEKGLTQVWRANFSVDYPLVWERRYNTGQGFGPWCQVHNSGSLVGTVSQSGGTPTGAVIERGSNANGEYWRRADGQQVCIFFLNIASTSSNVEWTFPAPFSSSPRLLATADSVSPSIPVTLNVSNVNADFRLFDNNGSRVTGNISVTAIGNWF